MNARVLAMALLAVLLSGNCMAVPQTREDCRASQLQSEVVSCIERGLYDPCDDGGGSWGRAQCAWAWTEVAERRVAKAEREILARLGQSKATTPALAAFRRSQGIWRSYRDSHCRFADATVDLEQFNQTSASHSGFCQRRITEQRAAELEAIVARHE